MTKTYITTARRLSLAIVAAIAFAGCAKSQPIDAAPATPAAGAVAKVEVAAEGSNFDPAVQKAQIPDGAWICDMDTVHYARMTEGDGTCPRCKMKLVKHPQAQ